jgi:type I restriction enzyme S subunit
MSEWKKTKLEEVLSFGNGNVKPKIEGTIPIYGGNGILGFGNEFNYNGETIIIGRVGAYCGSVYFENKPIWISDNALSAKPKGENNAKFFYYFLKHINLNQWAGGSSHPLVTQSLLNSLEFSICINTKTQTAIAAILSSLDDKIDLLHRQNATLEKMAETLFRQWFIEEAKEEWESRPLSSIANFLNGLACQKFPPKNDIEKLPVLKIKELNSGISENSDWATTEVNPEYIVKNGDVIFAWSASLMVKIWDGQDCILNQHLFKVTSEYYPKWFYYLWCKYHLDEFIVKAASHATTMGHIKRSDLDEAMVLIPSDKELEEMTLAVEPLISKIISNNKQIKLLVNLRDILLPKLMSGEIRVESHRDETSVETNNDTATLSPIGAAYKTNQHG